MAALTDRIALAASDELPETWAALRDDSEVFGEEGLLRLHVKNMRRIFNTELSAAEQEALSDNVADYAAKKLALAIIRPGRDFWTKQVIQRSAGERESSAYQDRGKDLIELRKELLAETAELLLEIGPELPVGGRGRIKDSPQVIQAGDSVRHLTPGLDEMDALFGITDETTIG